MSPDGAARAVGAELPVSIVTTSGVVKRFFVAIGLVILAVLWLALGLLLFALVVVIGALAGIGFLLWWAWAVLVNTYFGLRHRKYPVSFRFPRSPAWARLVLNDAVNSSVGTTLAAAARGSILFLGPLIFTLRLFLGWRSWRLRRSRTSVVDLPLRGSTLFRATLRALIDVGSHWHFFADGYEETTSRYNGWLASSFAEIGAFLAWWPQTARAVEDYAVEGEAPFPVTPDAPTDTRMRLQPSPDPRGFPGLASAVIRRRGITSLRDLYQSAREIDDMCDPNLDDSPDCAVVRVVHTTNRTWGDLWMVQVSSTQSWHPRAGQAPNDLTADLFAVSGRESSLLRGTLAAIAEARIPADAPVLMSGFSLGGLVAAQVATGRYPIPGVFSTLRVDHLITAGSPIARFPVAEGVRVLSLEHRIDPVHRLDGRPRATDTESVVPWVTVSAGPPLPPDYTLGHTHHAPSYAETGQAFAVELTDPIAQDYWNGSRDVMGAREYFSGRQVLTDFAIVRKGISVPRPAVPVYVQRAGEGQTRGRLRAFLRRLHGVIAADVYLSRSGFPTTRSWSVDLLVVDLDEALSPARRRFTYLGLLAVAESGGAIAISIRIMARDQQDG
ncbi:MAG TPA: hypothetical protein VFS93_00815, partial [Terrimesophilobacter sp.]|nr:hypothetical protein [Terrimesophilobacter sp.]